MNSEIGDHHLDLGHRSGDRAAVTAIGADTAEDRTSIVVGWVGRWVEVSAVRSEVNNFGNNFHKIQNFRQISDLFSKI